MQNSQSSECNPSDGARVAAPSLSFPIKEKNDMKLKAIFIFFVVFSSCSNLSSNSKDCIKVRIAEGDFVKINFPSIPLPVRNSIIELATKRKKMDTAFSLDKDVSYIYKNPGGKKGYIEQVLDDREMHIINGKCYEFLLHSMPYIIYEEEIYSLDQPLGFDCRMNPCQPDTVGINEIYVYSLSLKKILKGG